LPQIACVRQSLGLLNAFSPARTTRCRKTTAATGHVKGLSPGSQMRLPHVGRQNGGGRPPGSGTCARSLADS
jgi:hypothetical protein